MKLILSHLELRQPVSNQHSANNADQTSYLNVQVLPAFL